MRRRLTIRTVAVSALIIAVVAGAFAWLAVAIAQQRDAGERARRSQDVIAAALLTQQRLLAVQTSLRGYLVAGNPDRLAEYRAARDALPVAAVELLDTVGPEPVQRRRAQLIRAETLAYVNSYTDPVIARTRAESVRAGRALAAASDGPLRARRLSGTIDRLVDAERAASVRLAGDVNAASDRALWIAWIGLGLCVAALALATAFVARRIVMPVGRLAGAVERVRRGELDVEVPEHQGDEIGRLGAAFNAMARALEQSRGELENQNTELEMQAIALEERSAELAQAGDEARAQRDELEHTARQLALEKRRAERYGEFAGRLAGSRSARDLARVALDTLVSAAGADVGVLYAETWQDDSRWVRAAVLGLAPQSLPESVVAGGEGAAAAAVRAGAVGAGASGLRVRSTLAGETELRWEIHVPLRHGKRPVGVATLGGIRSSEFEWGEGATLQRLAGQAAVALAEAGALDQRNWLSQVNAAVLDGVREAIALIGRDHELILSNTAMDRLTAGRPISWQQLLARGEELVIEGKVLERYTAPVDDARGAPIGQLVVLRDVTREREADRLKSDLMATVSHELRTPLASVLGYAELLRTRPLDDAARSDIVATIHREAKRLSGLIDDFLDVQAIEQDRLVLARKPFSVSDVLTEQVGLFGGQSADHHVSLSLPAGDEPILVTGDRDRIAQVVANLLSNAIKYSPDGGEVAVSVAPALDGGRVEVSVADQGLGIPAQAQPHVFEKFFRAERDGAPRIGGTGLGLALAHEIVLAHGGEMGFESTEGQGSRFWFTLPTA